MPALVSRSSLMPTEHDEQVAVVRWAELLSTKHPELAELFCVPNGGHRHKAVAGKLKAEGVRRGVEDLMLLVPRRGFAGLLLELKRRNGVPSDVSESQRWWHERHSAAGFYVRVCYGHIMAIRVISEYLGIQT